MYDPILGLFIQRDPAGYKAGENNLYEYGQDSPTNVNDSQGLDSSDAVERELRELIARKFPSTKFASISQALAASRSISVSEFHELRQKDQAGRALIRLLDVANATKWEDIPQSQRIPDCPCGSWVNYAVKRWLEGDVTPLSNEERANTKKMLGEKGLEEREKNRLALLQQITESRNAFYRVDYVYWNVFTTREAAASGLAGALTCGLGGPLLWLVRHDLGVNDTHAGIRIYFYSGEEFYIDNGYVRGNKSHFFKEKNIPFNFSPEHKQWQTVK